MITKDAALLTGFYSIHDNKTPEKAINSTKSVKMAIIKHMYDSNVVESSVFSNLYEKKINRVYMWKSCGDLLRPKATYL